MFWTEKIVAVNMLWIEKLAAHAHMAGVQARNMFWTEKVVAVNMLWTEKLAAVEL